MAGSCLYCHAPHSGLNGTAGRRANSALGPEALQRLVLHALQQWDHDEHDHRLHCPWARTAPSASVAMMARWQGRRARWSLTGMFR